MMDANDALSHGPPPDWACYTDLGAEGAGNSNIAGNAAVAAVAVYMLDPGNATTLGHRRWLLSNSLGPTGIGSTDTFSCLWTVGGTGAAGREWMAWPPPGPFPIEAAGDEFLHFALEEPRRFEIAFLVRSTRARRYPDDFDKGRSPAGRLWMARLKELRAKGRLAPDVEPVEAGFSLWALAQGLVTLYRAGRFVGGAEDFRRFYGRSIRRALTSFIAREESER